MKGARRRAQYRGQFDLLEEATHLLRTAPIATLAAYYVGALPFVLGLLFFWADMSRSPFAPQHLASASLGLAALFLWLKFWQAIFAGRIRAQASAQEGPPLDFRRCARIFLSQAIIQPSGLFLVPLSLVPVLPFPWVCAFYQNASVLASGEKGGTGRLLKNSWRQACLWPGKNIGVLAITLAFGLFIFLNWTIFCLSLPDLFKMLFGIDSAFTQSPMAMLNTTFFTGMFGLTYLCVDPILRTIYTLRCFYGESLESGEDLKAELKPFAVSVQGLAGALVVMLSLWAAPAVAAGTNAPVPVAVASAKAGVSPAELDRVISQTVKERAYTWRMPREQVIEPDSGDNMFSRFIDRLSSLVHACARAVYHGLRYVWHKLFSGGHTPVAGQEGSGYGWIMSLQLLLYGLAVVVIAALLVLVLRVWQGRRPAVAAVSSTPVQPVPDIADENVRADQLPEDGWTKLGRELLERGEFRLAMRAFYLASLAHLAGRNLISIARFKSNRDYERELRRRAHALPGLLSVFGDNITVFERIWYGMHEANHELVTQFAANLERMRAA